MSRTLFLLALLVMLNGYINPSSFRRNFPYPVRKTPGQIAPRTSSVQAQYCDDYTIKVAGSATVDAQPDIALLSATLQANGDTSAKAVTALSQKVNKVLQTLTKNGVSKEDYETTSLRVFADVSYKGGWRQEKGQIAQQSLRITIRKIEGSGQNIGQIIDQLAVINGIVLNGLSFDLSDKTEAFEEARKKAFQEALNKAEDLSKMLEINLGKLVTLTDNKGVAPVVQSDNKMMVRSMSNEVSAPTEINVGDIPISYSVEAVYAFQ